MKNKQSYLEEVALFISQYQRSQDQLFEEMCKNLGVSEKDRDIFIDYCYNNFEFEEGKKIIKKYTE